MPIGCPDGSRRLPAGWHPSGGSKVHRHRRRGMPQNPLHHLGIGASGRPDRRGGMTQVMQPEPGARPPRWQHSSQPGVSSSTPAAARHVAPRTTRHPAPCPNSSDPQWVPGPGPGARPRPRLLLRVSTDSAPPPPLASRVRRSLRPGPGTDTRSPTWRLGQLTPAQTGQSQHRHHIAVTTLARLQQRPAAHRG
jgi:hypothetical protein